MFDLRFERDERAMLANPINGFDLRSEVYVDASILWGLVLNPWLSPNRIVIGVQVCEFMISQHGGDRGLKLIIHACSWGVKGDFPLLFLGGFFLLLIT